MPSPLVISVSETAGHAVRVREQYATGETISATGIAPGMTAVVNAGPGRRIVIDLLEEAHDVDGLATAAQVREFNGLLAKMVDRRRRTCADDPEPVASVLLAAARVPSLEPWLARLRRWDELEEAQHNAAK